MAPARYKKGVELTRINKSPHGPQTLRKQLFLQLPGMQEGREQPEHTLQGPQPRSTELASHKSAAPTTQQTTSNNKQTKCSSAGRLGCLPSERPPVRRTRTPLCRPHLAECHAQQLPRALQRLHHNSKEALAPPNAPPARRILTCHVRRRGTGAEDGRACTQLQRGSPPPPSAPAPLHAHHPAVLSVVAHA